MTFFWNTFYSTWYCKSEHFEVTANYSYCHFPKYVVTEVDTGGGRLHWIHFIWQTLDNSKKYLCFCLKSFLMKKKKKKWNLPWPILEERMRQTDKRIWSKEQYPVTQSSDLAPEHSSSGIICLEDHVEPLQLLLSEVGVMEEPSFILHLQTHAGGILTTAED